MNMRKTCILLPIVILGLAACQQTPDPVLTGAGTGAVFGAIVSDDRAEGAIIGAAVGAAAGGLVGAAQQGKQCRYTYPSGRSELRPCPPGY